MTVKQRDKETMKRILPVAALVFLLSGCYHAQVVTDRTPSTQVVEQQWASSWLGGLVPPKELDVSACTNGVAKVETQLSFLNMVAGAVTFGIYTPMTIKATCADGG